MFRRFTTQVFVDREFRRQDLQQLNNYVVNVKAMGFLCDVPEKNFVDVSSYTVRIRTP